MNTAGNRPGKGEARFQISRQAGTSYRAALWPGGCSWLGDKISCSPTTENVAGCGAGTAVKSAINWRGVIKGEGISQNG